MAEKTPKLVKARWVGTCESELPDRTVLISGETVVQIPEGEAIASENWEVVGGSGAPTAKDLRAKLKELDVEIPKGSKKSDLEALLTDAESSPADGTDAPSVEEPAETETGGNS